MSNQEEPKLKKVVQGADDLSLGISIVVAVIIGVGIGIGLEKLFHQKWVFWIGVVIGIGAAISNVFKAYKRQKIELDKIAKDPKYVGRTFDDEDDD